MPLVDIADFLILVFSFFLCLFCTFILKSPCGTNKVQGENVFYFFHEILTKRSEYFSTFLWCANYIKCFQPNRDLVVSLSFYKLEDQLKQRHYARFDWFSFLDTVMVTMKSGLFVWETRNSCSLNTSQYCIVRLCVTISLWKLSNIESVSWFLESLP